MSYEKDKNSIVISGFDKGISASPYTGIANIQNVNTTYYPGVAYVNYRRQAATLTEIGTDYWYAGTHSTDVSNNSGWFFTAPVVSMTNPIQSATSPNGINYILDDSGNIWKQTGVNGSTFNLLGGRDGTGHGGLAYWNNYLIVFGSAEIEFCGDGTGDAAITSSNWNKAGTPSFVTVTNTFLLFGTNWTGSVATSATSATLSSNWTAATGAYTVRFTNAANDVRTVTFTNGNTSATWTGGLTNDATNQFFMYQMTATAGTFVGVEQMSSGKPVTFSSTGTLPTGLTAGTTYYLLSTVDLSGSTVFSVATSAGGTRIAYTDAGTGTITMSLLASTSPPITNTTIAGWSWGTSGTGSTTMTLASPWLQASGIYNIVDTLGNNLQATFTYLSTTVTLLNPAGIQPAGTFSVQILNPSATTYKAYVSKVDGNLYFANGRWIGRISSSPNTNLTFNPGVNASYSVNYAATGLLQSADTVIDMTDLKSTMIILGKYDVYPWDYTSAQPSASSPVGELGYGIINILNNVFILAGNKGNIYTTNGYSAQLFYKIPDFVAGAIDPIWLWGGLMAHRSKLFFQAIAQTSAGVNIMAGIFSVIASPSILGETASGLVMEAQNSYGLTPASGAKQSGVLIDNQTWSSGQDSYYSAWSNGATTGGIDYNDSTLWQNFEPTIETDIIPVGDLVGTQKMTLGNIEFKLDRPMASGDQIRMYWRSSLTDSYVLLGTTTTAVLSAYYPSKVVSAQWMQFKVQFKGASSGSSFIPLRQITVHFA